MGFGVHISEAAAAELAAMDEVTSELLLMEMIGLSSDPLGRGVELERDGALSRRISASGCWAWWCSKWTRTPSASPSSMWCGSAPTELPARCSLTDRLLTGPTPSPGKNLAGLVAR